MLFKRIAKVFKSSFGNIIEWYDFSLYAYFATIISGLFFPSEDPWLSLLATFATFGVGFLARPFGSILFGYIGDKVGRHYAMNISITIMGITTIAMAFIPTWDQIGVWAPVILVIIRLLQGVSAGGQFTSLMTITTEDDSLKYRGFSLGVTYSTSVIGFLLAATVSYLVLKFVPVEYHSWAWRIPFVLGFFLLLIQFCLREDDKGTMDIVKREKSLHKILFKHYPKHLILTTILALSSGMLYYLVVTYLVIYLSVEMNMPLSTALGMSTLTLLAILFTTPLFGFMSDIFGRKRFHVITYVILCLTSYPIIYLLQFKSMYLIAAGMFLIGIFAGLAQGASTPYYTEIFPRRVRALGCAIGYGLGISLSGFAPMIGTYVTEVVDPTLGLTMLIFGVSAVGLVVAIFMPNTQAEVRRVYSISNSIKV